MSYSNRKTYPHQSIIKKSSKLLGGFFYEFRELDEGVIDTTSADARLGDETIEPLESELLEYNWSTPLESEEEVYRRTNSESNHFLCFREVGKYLYECLFLSLHPDA